MLRMIFQEKLLETKLFFPFENWRKNLKYGLTQYTKNCEAAKKIMDDLIMNLIKIGEDAPKKDKEDLFQIAIESLNELNDSTEIIETGEREELCELFNKISLSANLNPEDYGEGEGIASEWRDW